MKKLIKFCISLLFSSLLFFSCSKSGSDAGCAVAHFGTITISNTSSDPYDFYVDDQFVTTVKGNSIADKIHIDQGNNHKLYVKQVSGYIISPTEETKTLSVIKCNDYAWQIP